MMPELEVSARNSFRKAYGKEPDGIAFAPGRVNLIGEHVDYNDGLVLPMPVAAGTAVAWASHDGSETKVIASDFGEEDCFDPTRPIKPSSESWRSYVRGMAAQWDGNLPPLQQLITGDLPRGSGLSSSASLCIALGRAFAEATGMPVDATTLARRAQRTEHDFVGVACGIMDQMAVAAGEPGHAMLLDCRDLGFRQVAIPKDWAVLVVDSGVTRELVDGEYNARRRQCEAAAEALGVASLRDATMADLETHNLPEPEARCARHVVSEIARVKDATAAIERGDMETFGRILADGHASLRDEFDVSHPAVDQLVASLQRIVGPNGGARMTGAGFGGSVVVVLPANRLKEISDLDAVPVLRVI